MRGVPSGLSQPMRDTGRSFGGGGGQIHAILAGDRALLLWLLKTGQVKLTGTTYPPTLGPRCDLRLVQTGGYFCVPGTKLRAGVCLPV